MRIGSTSKLIYYLSALSSEDRSLFLDFLSSPIFNRREEPRKLYAFILEKGIPQEEISAKEAWQYIWPKEAFAAGRLNKLKSELVGLLLKFLEYRQWESHSAESGTYQTEALLELNDESFFPGAHKKAFQKTHSAKNLQIFRDRYDLSVQMLAFQNRNQPRDSVSYLNTTLVHLRRMVYADVLKLGFVARNQGSIVGAGDLPMWLEALIDQIQAVQLEGEPLLEIYYLLYVTLTPFPAIEDLKRLRDLVTEHVLDCSLEESLDIFTGAINNFQRQQTYTGQKKLRLLLGLYQSFAEIYVKKQGGHLLPGHFKNMVSLGARLGEWRFLENAIQNVQQWMAIEGMALQQAVDFGKGVLFFHQKKFKRAETSFSKVIHATDDVFYSIDSRAYLLMCYQENGKFSEMESLAHAFNMYLRRSTGISQSHKSYYLSFLGIWKRFLNTPTFKKDRFLKLVADIEALPESAGKEWLQGKLEERAQ